MTTTTSAAPRWLGTKQAAAYLGVSHPTVKRLVARKVLRSYRPEGLKRVIIDVADLDRFVTGGKA